MYYNRYERGEEKEKWGVALCFSLGNWKRRTGFLRYEWGYSCTGKGEPRGIYMVWWLEVLESNSRWISDVKRGRGRRLFEGFFRLWELKWVIENLQNPNADVVPLFSPARKRVEVVLLIRGYLSGFFHLLPFALFGWTLCLWVLPGSGKITKLPTGSSVSRRKVSRQSRKREGITDGVKGLKLVFPASGRNNLPRATGVD